MLEPEIDGASSLSLEGICAQKRQQAQQLLGAGELWLIAARETGVRPEPALQLILPCDFTWDAFVILTGTAAIAIVGRYDAPGLPAGWEVISYDEDPGDALRSVLRSLNPRRVLIDSSPDHPLMDGLSHGLYLKLQSLLPGITFNSAEQLLGRLRSLKTPQEQRLLARAVRRAEEDLTWVAEILQPGMSEREATSLLQDRLRADSLEPAWGWQGCPGFSFGRQPSHAGSGDRILEEGQLVHVDYGVRMGGYCSDLQRVWLCAGEPDLGLNAAFAAVRQAIDAAAAALRPGARGYQVDAAARAIITSAGYPEYLYATGHNLGRATHDGGPLLGPRWARYGRSPEGSVEAGQVYAIELGVMVEGAGYLGLEEDVLVSDSGSVWLSEREEALWKLP